MWQLKVLTKNIQWQGKCFRYTVGDTIGPNLRPPWHSSLCSSLFLKGCLL